MEQPETPPPVAEESSAKTTTSLGARLMNVFASPGEVFDEIKASPPATGNWLLPVALNIFIGIVFAMVVFSQPAIQQEMRAARRNALDQQVQAGKLTQAQADAAEAKIDQFFGPSMMKALGIIGAIIGTFMKLFWWSLVIWLMARWFLRMNFPYSKAMDVVGHSLVIAALGSVVTMLLMVALGRLSATPSLALMVHEFDLTNRSHLLLASLNLFNIWFVAVVSVGLAKLSGVSAGKAAACVFGYWIVFELLMIAGRFAQMAM